MKRLACLLLGHRWNGLIGGMNGCNRCGLLLYLRTRKRT